MLFRVRRPVLAAVLTILATATPAVAQITGALPPISPASTTPALKRDVTVMGDIVRIGDMIENAGASARVPIFRAPDLGQTGSVPAARVVEAVRAHGFTIVETHGVTDVAVTRASRMLTVKDIEGRIADALAGQPGLGEAKNLSVTIERDARTIHLDPAAGELQATRLFYDPRSGRYDVTFEIPGNAARRAPLRFVGTIVETVEAAVLTRALGRGDVVKTADVAVERRPKAEARGEIATSLTDVVGFATRRAVRVGEIVRPADLTKPDVVQRNETVTIVYEVPGLMLTMRGKAMEAGAQGDTVNVLNLQSKRTVQGTVTGPSQVTVAAPTRVTRASAPAPAPTQPAE